jgi:2-amino-4-hydroxy-6-hydroxymethyldihydropteridine diphosphokinase
MPSRDPVKAYVGLGANLGAARQAVEAAIESLDALPLTRVTQRSSLYRSAPVDASGPDFINAVVELRTQLEAPRLLAEMQRLETTAGRERPWRNAPRTLDLDLLLYGDARIDSAALTVPHPRLAQRAFVLRPLAQIAPDRVRTEWLAAVADQVIEPLAASR